MAQLEYNLPILILGPTSSAQTITATTSKANAVVSRVRISFNFFLKEHRPLFQYQVH